MSGNLATIQPLNDKYLEVLANRIADTLAVKDEETFDDFEKATKGFPLEQQHTLDARVRYLLQHPTEIEI